MKELQLTRPAAPFSFKQRVKGPSSGHLAKHDAGGLPFSKRLSTALREFHADMHTRNFFHTKQIRRTAASIFQPDLETLRPTIRQPWVALVELRAISGVILEGTRVRQPLRP